MTRAVTERAKALARSFEGYRDKAYLCPAGVWTIGYGHTHGVKAGDVCTQAQAEIWLTNDFFEAAQGVERALGEDVVLSLTDEQHDALCDFVLNLGPNPSATLWKKLKARDYKAVPAELSRWVYAGKTKLNGLVRRRNAEIALWSEGEPGSADEPTSSSVTRTADTPPAPAPATLTPAHIATAAVAAAGGLAEGAKQVTGIIAPYAGQSELVQHALSYAATVGAAAAVAVVFLAFVAKRAAKQ